MSQLGSCTHIALSCVRLQSLNFDASMCQRKIQKSRSSGSLLYASFAWSRIPSPQISGLVGSRLENGWNSGAFSVLSCSGSSAWVGTDLYGQSILIKDQDIWLDDSINMLLEKKEWDDDKTVIDERRDMC